MENIRTILKSQYRSSLIMLKGAIEPCPDELWHDEKPTNCFWQIAYHSLFFAQFYAQVDEASFQPWSGHQHKVQYPDAIPGPEIEGSDLPLIAAPYSKSEVLAYWTFCETNIDQWLDLLDLNSSESGFSWYKVSKLEHQIINIRHIQHGAAQLADRLRSHSNIGVAWKGAALK